MSDPLATYMLTLHGPEIAVDGITGVHIDRDHLREAEENLTDLLPKGWWVEIHEWDEPLDDEKTLNHEFVERIRAYGGDTQ